MYESVAARDGALGEKLRRSTLDCETTIASPATPDDLARCDLRFRPKMVEESAGQPRIYSMTVILQGAAVAPGDPAGE